MEENMQSLLKASDLACIRPMQSSPGPQVAMFLTPKQSMQIIAISAASNARLHGCRRLLWKHRAGQRAMLWFACNNISSYLLGYIMCAFIFRAFTSVHA